LFNKSYTIFCQNGIKPHFFLINPAIIIAGFLFNAKLTLHPHINKNLFSLGKYYCSYWLFFYNKWPWFAVNNCSSFNCLSYNFYKNVLFFI